MSDRKRRNGAKTASAKSRKPQGNTTKVGGKGSKSEKKLEITLIRSYPRQIAWDVWLPGIPVKETTTVTTGLINSVYQIVSSNIVSFAVRFGATFVEYRIVQALAKLRLFSSTNPGVIQSWFDEQTTTTPALVEAQERYILSTSAASVDTRPQLMWTCADPLDLQYHAIGTAYTPVSFKFYTNNANFGSSVVATDYFEVEVSMRVQFRGLLGT
jgi:hypothetical protein